MAKGSGFLKVTGILMVIFGAIALITSITGLLGISALVALSGGLLNATWLYVGAFISLVSAVAELVAGIVGIKNCKAPEKAGTCMTWGIIVAALCLLGCIFTVVGGDSFPVMSLIFGMVLPVLYIIGAAKNKA